MHADAVLERLSDAGGAGADFASLFRWVFVAAASFLAAAFVAVLCIAERPLRGPAVRPAPGSHERSAASH